MALATDTPSLVIFGPPKLWPKTKSVSNRIYEDRANVSPTDNDRSAFWTKSRRDGLGENVDTSEHALPGIVAKDDILGVSSLRDGRDGLGQSGGSGKGGTGSSNVHHRAGVVRVKVVKMGGN